MEVSPGGRLNGMVSNQKHTTVQAGRCSWDELEACAWQGERPSATPNRCMVQHCRGAAAGSGVQLRSLQAGLAAGQLDWSTGVLTARVECFLSRLYLARMQIWAGPQRDLLDPAIVVPLRISSAIMFRAVCALVQRGTFGAAS